MPRAHFALPHFILPRWLEQYALLDDCIDAYTSSTTPNRRISTFGKNFASHLNTLRRISALNLTLPPFLDTARIPPVMAPPTFASAAAGNNSHTPSSRDAGSEWCVKCPTDPVENFALATLRAHPRCVAKQMAAERKLTAILQGPEDQRRHSNLPPAVGDGLDSQRQPALRDRHRRLPTRTPLRPAPPKWHFLRHDAVHKRATS